MKALSILARFALFLLVVIPISAKLAMKGEPLAAVGAFVLLGALACVATESEN